MDCYIYIYNEKIVRGQRGCILVLKWVFKRKKCKTPVAYVSPMWQKLQEKFEPSFERFSDERQLDIIKRVFFSKTSFERFSEGNTEILKYRKHFPYVSHRFVSAYSQM